MTHATCLTRSTPERANLTRSTHARGHLNSTCLLTSHSPIASPPPLAPKQVHYPQAPQASLNLIPARQVTPPKTKTNPAPPRPPPPPPPPNEIFDFGVDFFLVYLSSFLFKEKIATLG
jgi:hypothetical protein